MDEANVGSRDAQGVSITQESGKATASADPGAASSAVKRRPTAVVAGASGFVGRALLPELTSRFDVVALSRGRRPDEPSVRWRRCDLFSLLDAERALEGADVAVYLVHSMLPREALVQGSFADLDLTCADNFGRAARRAGVRQIVYLGGLVPPVPEHELSPHLRSRLEVERALGSHGVPVTALRAGLVVGAGGSSLEILVRLVRRLPAMIVPEWAETRTQPIALADIVHSIAFCLDNADTFGAAYDVGGPTVLTYREMMQETARVLGVRRPMFPVPLLTPRLSGLWVSVITGSPRALVDPLIESLLHPMLARERRLQERMGRPGQAFAEALTEALEAEERWRAEREATAARAPAVASTAAASSAAAGSTAPAAARPVGREVRSVQRLRLPPGWSADAVARAYVAWLPRFLRWVIRAERPDPMRVVFRLRPGGVALLELTYSEARSTADRALLYVTGGALAAIDPTGERRGRLELREVLGGTSVLAAVHGFVPRLPWLVYVSTQARFHLLVMHAFGRYLERCARRGTPPPDDALPAASPARAPRAEAGGAARP